jgi:hypothetical protein
MTAHMGFCPSRGIRALPCVLRISGDPSTKSVCDQCDDDQHLLTFGQTRDGLHHNSSCTRAADSG